MENQQELEHFFDIKEAFLDNFIGDGSDHELFITSYIHGHFSVVAAKTMQQLHTLKDSQHAISFFIEHLRQSIFKAIDNGELEGEDATDVKNMLEKLVV